MFPHYLNSKLQCVIDRGADGKEWFTVRQEDGPQQSDVIENLCIFVSLLRARR